jgi:hypothetical protein
MRRGRNKVIAGMALLSFGPAFFLGPMTGRAVAQGTAQQQMACQSDAFRLCSQFIPNPDTVKACMIKQIRSLSADCRAEFSKGPAPKKVLNAAPATNTAVDRNQAM